MAELTPKQVADQILAKINTKRQELEGWRKKQEQGSNFAKGQLARVSREISQLRSERDIYLNSQTNKEAGTRLSAYNQAQARELARQRQIKQIKSTQRIPSQKQKRIITQRIPSQKQKRIINGKVTKAPSVGSIGKLERRRNQLRTKILRGQKLTGLEQAELFGATALQSGLSFGEAIINFPSTLVAIAKDPSILKQVPENIAKGGREFGELIRVSPTEAFAKIGTEIVLLKGTGKALEVVGGVTKKVATRLSPAFKGVEKGAIEVTTTTARGGNKIKLKVGGPVSKITESLPKQAEISGKTIRAVSGQAKELINLVKKNRIIRKPIPGEDLLKPVTKKLLRQFDEGKITSRNLVRLESRIVRETKGQGSLLERSFYADPRGRFRPSRLGLKKPKRATLIDELSGDVTYKSNKPQILVFEDVKVQNLPKNILKKLKAGKPLTKSEAEQLLKFQLKKSGKFKPIGQLSREPEVTLAPGEIIKKKKKLGVTLIKGKRVTIYQVEVLKPKGRLKTLLNKAQKTARKVKGQKKVKTLTTAEKRELEKLLEKQTGFKGSLSRSRRTLPKGTRRLKIPSRPNTSKIKTTRRKTVVRRKTERKSIPRRKKSIPRRSSRSTVKRRSTQVRRSSRSTSTRRSGRPPVRKRRGGRTTKIPRRPARPPARTIRGSRKKIKRKKTKSQNLAFNVYAKPIKTIKGKETNKLIKINKVPLTKTRAKDLRNYISDTSLSRTAQIVPVKAKAQKPKLKIPKGYASKTSKKFRTYRQVKGKRKRLPKGKVIEKRRNLLDTRQEKKGITLRRRIKQLTPKRKVIKRKVTKKRKPSQAQLRALKKARRIRALNLKKRKR